MLKLVFYILSLLMLSWFAWRWANRFFNLPCPFWMDWLMETRYMQKVLSTEETIRRAKIEIGQDVLDLGCGSGRIAIPIAKKLTTNGRILAIDLQQGMISKLDLKIASFTLKNIKTEVQDLDQLEFGDRKFDRVIVVMLVGELKDPNSFFQKLNSLLKPDGIVSISEVLPDPHYQHKNLIISLANRNNLAVLEVFDSFFAYTVNLSKSKKN